MPAKQAQGAAIADQPADKSVKVKRSIIQSITDGQGRKIHLPPRKKRRHGKCLQLRFVITGTIPSKKNRQIATINHRRIKGIVNSYYKTSSDKLYKELLEVKPYIRPAKLFIAWQDKVSEDIVLQAARWHKIYEKHHLVFPISNASVFIYHYWADPKGRDNSNKLESINDMLVSAGIITDDVWQNLSPVAADADLYKGEIREHITIITITAYL